MIKERRVTFCFLCLLITTFLFGLPSVAFAILGETKETVENDRQKISGSRESQAHGQYSIETINASGLIVHEYVAQNGTIFAVSWTGNRFPDLNSLLGSYFNEYQKTLLDWRKNVPHRRGPLRLRSTNLSVDTGGRRPKLWGRAYVPSFLPSGVTEEEIQ